MLGQKGLSTLQLWYVYAVYVTLPKQSINQLIHSMYIYQGFHQVWYQGIVKAKYLDTQMSKEILNYLTYIYYDSQILVHFSSGTYSQFLPVHGPGRKCVYSDALLASVFKDTKNYCPKSKVGVRGLRAVINVILKNTCQQ